jgi:diguanylate cyclase (GGDEF)-like protein/PAS domain S-box-containing protein
VKQRYRIGLIAPYLDGEYYGRILPFIQQEIRAAESQLIALQVADDYLGITVLEEPVAFDLVDAWILLLPSASLALLDLIGESKKPFACVGFHSPYAHGHTVLVANRESMRKAVTHLIEHGHREIAFIANCEQHDLSERYLGYRDALEMNGIPFDDSRVVLALDNMQDAGFTATQTLLKREVSFTAVVAGTDWNALGAIDCLESVGLNVPGHIAVIGFDDIHQAEVNNPPLTTTKQPFGEMGITAVRRVINELEGMKCDGSKEVLVPAAFISRTSCGCDQRAMFKSSEDFNDYIENLSQLRMSLHQIAINNYKMTRGLILATKEEKIHLSHLHWNLFHWGCLALWETDDRGQRQLVVSQVFGKNGDPVPPVGEVCRLEEFPPIDYLPSGAKPGGEDIVVVYRVASELQNWGYMALVGPVDPLNNVIANDLSRHSFTILAVALEREMLFKQVRSIADKLEIVSRTTSDGIWDWDLVTNKVNWNMRAHKVFGRMMESLTDQPSSFIKLVHPENRATLRRYFRRPYRKNQPLQLEFRVRVTEDQYIWVFMACEIIWNKAGEAIRIIGSLTDISEKKANESRITQLAYHDALTGLPNRLLFRDRLRKAMNERQRDGQTLAVMMIDLDRFKIVNDTLGHQVGDELLQSVAQVLNASLGEQDTLARLGGDEFIVLLSTIEDETEIMRTSERMLGVLTKPFLLEGRQFFLSASIGACTYPSQGTDVDSLIRFADMAMYHSKEIGGNRLTIYTPTLGSMSVERVNLESGLRFALENKEFELYFQPQVALSKGNVYGAEALIRWTSLDGQMIMPGEFIPLAEETGLIIPIGQWVLEQACAECRRWMNAGMPELVISVNISVLQFQQETFPELVRKVIKDSGIQPFNLCLEITEYTAVQNMEHSIVMLGELVKIGVKIAIDDFGMGQSSLLWLKKLPVHVVKIDPSFILNMIEDSDDDAIAKAVIEMSHNLGLSVTAEGVETEGQLNRLQQLQCDRIQGFYTGRPMTSDQFIAYFQEISSWH